VEEEAEARTLGGNKAQELLIGDGFDVLASIADGGPENTMPYFLTEIHGIHNRIVMS
jgi:hypothetical protein